MNWQLKNNRSIFTNNMSWISKDLLISIGKYMSIKKVLKFKLTLLGPTLRKD